MTSPRILLLVDTGRQQFSDLLKSHDFEFDAEDWTVYEGENLSDYSLVIFSSDGTVKEMKESTQEKLLNAVKNQEISLIVFEFASFMVSNNTVKTLGAIFPLIRGSGWTESMTFTSVEDEELPEIADRLLTKVDLPCSVYMSGSETTLSPNASALVYMRDKKPAVAVHKDYNILHFTMCPTYVSANYFSSWAISPLKQLFVNAIDCYLNGVEIAPVDTDALPLVKHLELSLQDESSMDLAFITSDQQRVLASRWLICLRSPHFYSIIGSPLRSEEDTTVTEIEVDETAVNMKRLVLFFYQDNFDFKQISEMGEIISLRNTAAKFCVERLKLLCDLALVSRVSTDNFWDILETIPHQEMSTPLANKLLNMARIRAKVLIKSKKAAKLLEQNPEWKKVMDETIERVNKRSSKKINNDKCITM